MTERERMTEVLKNVNTPNMEIHYEKINMFKNSRKQIVK